jgi:preprotein translocase subunit SecG
MLLQTVLYLTSVVSAIALIALILIQDRPGQLPSPGLRRATVWSTGLFLTSALLIALADSRITGSLLDTVEAAPRTVVGSTDLPASDPRPVSLGHSEAGLDPLAR